MVGTEFNVVVGLSIISFLLAYYAFKLREGADDVTKKVALFLFFMSVLFVNLIMYSLVLISQNTDIGYLQNSVVYMGLQVLTYTTLFGLVIYFIAMIVLAVGGFIEYAKTMLNGRGKNDQ